MPIDVLTQLCTAQWSNPGEISKDTASCMVHSFIKVRKHNKHCQVIGIINFCQVYSKKNINSYMHGRTCDCWDEGVILIMPLFNRKFATQ